jgi:SGNH domain (fused to AT3 domains)
VVLVVAALLLSGCTGARSVAAGSTPSPVSAPATTVSPSPLAPTSAAPTPRHTPVKVAIFGDSQGTALYATRPAEVAKSLRLSDLSISACGILRGRVVSRSGERFDLIGACPNWLDKWRTDAKRVKPEIALVVIGAWDVFDLRTADHTLTFATPAWDANFLATLRLGLAAIRQSGAQIALAELPCYRPRRTNPRPPGWWPERGDDARTRHVNDLLRQVADGRRIFTVAPASAFCTTRSVGDNRSYRYDGVHYLRPGATVYFDAIIPQLVHLPR